MLRVERRRATQLAGLRFAVTLGLLVFVFVVLSLTVWAEVQRLFGLYRGGLLQDARARLSGLHALCSHSPPPHIGQTGSER